MKQAYTTIAVGDLTVKCSADGMYVNAKPLLQIRAGENGKVAGDWDQFKRTDGAKEVMQLLRQENIVPYVSKRGQGTFVHRALALELAGYCRADLKSKLRECMHRHLWSQLAKQSTFAPASSSSSLSAAAAPQSAPSHGSVTLIAESNVNTTASPSLLLHDEHWKRKVAELEFACEQARKRAKLAEDQLADADAERAHVEHLKHKLDAKENEVKQMRMNCDSARSKLDAQTKEQSKVKQNMASLIFSNQEYIKQLSHVKQALVANHQQLREANGSMEKVQRALMLEQDTVRQHEHQIALLQQELQTLTTATQEQAAATAAPAPIVEEVMDVHEHKKLLDTIQRDHENEKRQLEEKIAALTKELEEQRSNHQTSTTSPSSSNSASATVTEREKWQLDMTRAHLGMARASALQKCIDVLSAQ